MTGTYGKGTKYTMADTISRTAKKYMIIKDTMCQSPSGVSKVKIKIGSKLLIVII